MPLLGLDPTNTKISNPQLHFIFQVLPVHQVHKDQLDLKDLRDQKDPREFKDPEVRFDSAYIQIHYQFIIIENY